MGSLENGFQLKRERDNPLLRSSSTKPRSRLARFVLFKKLDYLQWVCCIAVFFFIFILIFQMFLPGSGIEKSEGSEMTWQVIGGLDFGEGIEFEPRRILTKFNKDFIGVNVSDFSIEGSRFGSRKPLIAMGSRFGSRKPLIAMVFADLLIDPQQIQMVTVVVALREIGYEFEVLALENGRAGNVWEKIGVQVTILKTEENEEVVVDWLRYDGIIVNSLEARQTFSRLLQEPFKSVPIIWTINDKTLYTQLIKYISEGKFELVNDWQKFFNRSTIVLFPNYALPMYYSPFDSGNFFVVPGSPAEAWEANKFMLDNNNSGLIRNNETDDFVIAIVGSRYMYKGLWLEHALFLEALLPLVQDLSSHLKIVILSGDDSTGNYSMAVEAIASSLKYPKNIVSHSSSDEDENIILSIASVVIYGSFLQELSFPNILVKAMSFEKLIVAPNLPTISKYVDDRVNGYLFPKENINLITQILKLAISEGKLSPSAHVIASNGKHSAKKFLVSETVEGYAYLLENVLEDSKRVMEIPSDLKDEWQWKLFESILDSEYPNRTLKALNFLGNIEKKWNNTESENSGGSRATDESFVYELWDQEKNIQMANAKRKREEDQLKDRTVQTRGLWEDVYKNAKKADRSRNDLHERDEDELERTGQPLTIYEPYFGEGTWPFLHQNSLYRGLALLKDRTVQTRGLWEDVYKNAKKADRSRNDLHERDEDELERTGQPLTIYEPYFGEGTWPFLHQNSLYRGLALSNKGRRPGTDDIDATSRLALLNKPYYRNALGEFGGFLAIANRIDRVHKNAWIGFQSWRASARKESLSKVAEISLLEAIQARKNGDTLYFWARMDTDPRNPLNYDFWSFCDFINSGNCKYAYSEAMKKMYGIKDEEFSVPPMPVDGDTWSVMHSWALPTKSFLEFVMFSRMFVDSLDAQFYDEHHQTGHCRLSLSKDKNCYSRVLELLVNVWAYHSARKIIYINPITGALQEQHKLKARKSKMWIKWFSFPVLKAMDEDLAEEFDIEDTKKRWLWPNTGEVYYQGIYEKERHKKDREKAIRKKLRQEKLERMSKKHGQKAIGKYIKPPPEEGDLNSTVVGVDR